MKGKRRLYVIKTREALKEKHGSLVGMVGGGDVKVISEKYIFLKED